MRSSSPQRPPVADSGDGRAHIDTVLDLGSEIKEFPTSFLLTHAWNYFDLHAKQRLSVFNFFVVLSGFVSGGLAASIQGSDRLGLLGIFLGLLLALISFVFWKLDQRVSFLIKHAEAALSQIERTLPDESARLFLSEPDRTDAVTTSGCWWFRHWTYGQCFRSVFITMAVVGICGSVLSALLFVQSILSVAELTAPREAGIWTLSGGGAAAIRLETCLAPRVDDPEIVGSTPARPATSAGKSSDPVFPLE